jgi:rhodanese-related sulfurtransferase
MTTASVREVTVREAWEALQRGEAKILDLRTKHERRRYGWPPGARRVSLLRHVLWPQGEGTIYLCQHANRSKLTRWRGAAEVAGGWKDWRAQGLPVERADKQAG